VERRDRRAAVIARVWSAKTTKERVPQYAGHLADTVIPELRALAGFEGAQLLQRNNGDSTEIVVITFWQSLEAIRRFAGDDTEGAVVPEKAARLLESYDRRVKHYELTTFDPTP
jgi:heme-degrading monooxygenase HmoA